MGRRGQARSTVWNPAPALGTGYFVEINLDLMKPSVPYLRDLKV